MMKQYSFTILLFVYISVLAQVELTEKKLPEIIVAKYDSIITSHTDGMMPSMSQFLGINIKDILDLNAKKNFGEYEENDFVTDCLSIYVDAKNSNFSVHFWPFVPPPPPPTEDEKYSKLKRKNPIVYDELMEKKFDSMSIAWKKQFEIEIRQHQTAYPVYIFNNSRDKRKIQRPIDGTLSKDLYVILEAMDENGKWQPIEYWEQFRFVCGTDHYDFVLNPKTFLIVAMKRYSGDYKTKLRVKFRNFDNTYYSNVFEDFIDHGQFNKQEVMEILSLRFSDRGKEYLEERIKRTFLDN